VASLLSRDERASRLTVFRRHQLTPELAADFAIASRVILIDAEVHGRGNHQHDGSRISVREVAPAVDDRAASSHHCDPSTLLALTRALCGSVPRASLVAGRGDSFEVGGRLTDDVRAVLPLVVETAIDLAEGRRNA